MFDLLYSLKQKAFGALAIVAGILAIYFNVGAIIALFMIPAGIYLIFTNKIVDEHDYYVSKLRYENKETELD